MVSLFTSYNPSQEKEYRFEETHLQILLSSYSSFVENVALKISIPTSIYNGRDQGMLYVVFNLMYVKFVIPSVNGLCES